MNQDMNFIHFTDTHIASESPFLNLDSFSKLRNAIAAVKDMAPQFFIISGDLTHNGDEAAYERFKQLVDEIESAYHVPVLLALGNHDFRVPFRSVMFNEKDTDENKPYYYSRTINDLRVIVLDSKIPGKDEGAIDTEQLAWLADELAKPTPGGDLIVLHHPPISNPLMPQSHLLSNADQLGEVLKGHADTILGILSGHIHFVSFGLFHGIPSTAGTGVAFTLDPSASEGLRMLDGSGFNLVSIRNGALTVNPYEMPGEQREVYFYKFSEMAQAAEHTDQK